MDKAKSMVSKTVTCCEFVPFHFPALKKKNGNSSDWACVSVANTIIHKSELICCMNLAPQFAYCWRSKEFFESITEKQSTMVKIHVNA